MLIENKTLYTKMLFEIILNGYSLYTYKTANTYTVANLKPDEGKPELTIVCYGGIVDEVLKAVNILFIDEEILVDIFVV